MNLPVNYASIRDEFNFSQDGTPEPFKTATFYLGKHGPFTERLAATADWHLELARRIAALKAALEALPT